MEHFLKNHLSSSNVKLNATSLNNLASHSHSWEAWEKNGIIYFFIKFSMWNKKLEIETLLQGFENENLTGPTEFCDNVDSEI